MKRRWKILGGMAVVAAVGLGVFAVVLARDGACPPPEAPAVGTTMRAVLQPCYGGPEVLRTAVVAKPQPAPDQVLVRVVAAAANPLDWHGMRGDPYIMRLSSGIGVPAVARFGVDFAGVVEAVGSAVQGYAPGDAVFGAASGAFAEYIVVRPARIAKKPADLAFADAAAMPVAAVTALQALRDKAGVQPGQRVLVNGASGGVGTYAVQIAKALGAEVTGVCSARNVELVRGLGADHVIDYGVVDFTTAGVRYDAIIDLVGNHPASVLAGVLEDDGVAVIVGGQGRDSFLGPMSAFIASAVVDPFVAPRFERLLAEIRADDLGFLAGLATEGRLRTVVDRSFPLAEVPAAIAHLETGRARGKIVIEVAAP